MLTYALVVRVHIQQVFSVQCLRRGRKCSLNSVCVGGDGGHDLPYLRNT